MQPDIDLQIQVVIKALREVVLPAVDVENKPAVEQLQLSLHILTTTTRLLPLRRRVVRAQLRETIEMATAILALVPEPDLAAVPALAKAVAVADEALHDVDRDTAALFTVVATLNAAISEAVTDLQGTDCYRQVARQVVRLSERQIKKSRAWCFDNGLETEVTLAALAELV